MCYGGRADLFQILTCGCLKLKKVPGFDVSSIRSRDKSLFFPFCVLLPFFFSPLLVYSVFDHRSHTANMKSFRQQVVEGGGNCVCVCEGEADQHITLN